MHPQQHRHCEEQQQEQQLACKPWQQVTATLAQLLHTFGLDIVHAFPVQLLNTHSPEDHQLPTFSRIHSTLAVIIGNSNALWRPFLQQLAHEAQLQDLSDPLDAYVEQHIRTAVQHCCCSCVSQAGCSALAAPQPAAAAAAAVPAAAAAAAAAAEAAAEAAAAVPGAAAAAAGLKQAQQYSFQQQEQQQQQHEQQGHLNTGQEHAQQVSPTQQQQQQQQQQQAPAALRHELRFSHQTGPKFVNMLRAAQLSGLAYYSPTTHLAMHARYGPWFALRAVAVFDCEGPDPADSAFDQVMCPYSELEQQAAQEMHKLEGLGGLANWQAHWRKWAELRALGGKHTNPRYCYCPDQLEYHYTKSKAVFSRAINALQQVEDKDQQAGNPAAAATATRAL